MAVIDQVITDRYAIYNADCVEVMQKLPNDSVHISCYSPPFAGLWVYSSSEKDLSNARSYEEFFKHYDYVVNEVYRLTMPGRVTAVHCMDVPRDGANLNGGLMDFPGDIIRQHEKIGFRYCARYHVWKEPLAVRNRTMAKGLAHRQIVEDSALCDVASADYLLMFRKKGENKIPVAHPQGLLEYAGERKPPADVMKFKGWTGNQIENRYSHWIWRQYASSFWDDVRLGRVLPYKSARDSDDERHVHPLQLDVVDRCVNLWSNPGETLLTPFLGVGSEAFGAVANGRRAIGMELKPVYFKQAVANLASIANGDDVVEQMDMFATASAEMD